MSEPPVFNRTTSPTLNSWFSFKFSRSLPRQQSKELILLRFQEWLADWTSVFASRIWSPVSTRSGSQIDRKLTVAVTYQNVSSGFRTIFHKFDPSSACSSALFNSGKIAPSGSEDTHRGRFLSNRDVWRASLRMSAASFARPRIMPELLRIASGHRAFAALWSVEKSSVLILTLTWTVRFTAGFHFLTIVTFVPFCSNDTVGTFRTIALQPFGTRPFAGECV